MDEHQITQGRVASSIERIAYSILSGMIVLLPFFFIPSNFFSFQTAKGLLVAIGVVAALAVFIVALIRDARLVVPKNLLSLSIVLLPVVFLASTLAHGAPAVSIFGYNLEVGTVAFVFFGAVLTLLVSQLFQPKERGFYTHLGLLVSFVVVALFQLIRLFFGPDTLTFGMFTSGVANVLGNWNDLAIFFGATTLLSLITTDMVELKRSFKVITYTVFLVSLFLLAVVNFITAWYVLGIFALLFFLFLVSFDKFLPGKNPVDGEALSPKMSARKISWNALAVLFISLAFIFFGTSLGQKISTTFDVVSVEVRPGWGATYSVIKSSLADNVLFGSGPNNFSHAWTMYKPLEVNNTLFWGTDFAAGIGLIPTFVATTGLLGLFALFFFFVMYVLAGIKAIFNQSEDSFTRYLVASSFFLSLFFWVMAILYVPGIVNSTLAFFFTGLFMASLYREGMLKQTTLSFEHKPKVSFVSVLALVVLLLLNVTLGYMVVQKSIALGYFQRSVIAASQNADLASVEDSMLKAIALDKSDLYYRGLSELNLIRVNEALGREGATPESVREEFQINIANSIENARMATQINPQNYLNWLGLARVYAALVPQPFAIPGAYDNAKKTYEEAAKVNPSSPLISLSLARLEVSNGDLAAARTYVTEAIAKKNNYAEAHFLLAQIEVTEGNINKAIPALETTVILTPDNAGLYFQLGLLKYNDRNWEGAAQAFGQAVRIVPEYANAKYFLGLSYHRLGGIAEAIAIFKDLVASNPDNAEVKLILQNLEEGKDPFANAQAPITNRPEQRETLPIPEGN